MDNGIIVFSLKKKKTNTFNILNTQLLGGNVNDSVFVVHGFSCSAACGIFLDQGWKPASPALTGRFLTTGPPGKT